MAPLNALCIVQSEISLMLTALKNFRIPPSRQHQELKRPIFAKFVQLKSSLDSISSLKEIDPLDYLNPFLDVIRSEEITGPITSLALTAVDKFLSYGLLALTDEFSHPHSVLPGAHYKAYLSVATAAEAIAESGTQARFVGTDRGSDEVVLMKVLHLLRTLLLVPVGSLISDRVVREVLQTCFRICFEPKLSELLRRTAEMCLASIMQLFFSRLPFLVSMVRPQTAKECPSSRSHQGDDGSTLVSFDNPIVAAGEHSSTVPAQSETDNNFAGCTDIMPCPYGLPAIHDLMHYLISLLTPDNNSDTIISVALGLLTIALETGADTISNCPTLLRLIQSDLTKNLLLLLHSTRVWQVASTLRLSFILFESMRSHLKLQMEVYLQRLLSISSPDNELVSYELREITLEAVVRLLQIPGLPTELYINYDCDVYCSNLFEDLTRMLAKNAYPVDALMGTHLLSLDALLFVLNTIATDGCPQVQDSQQQQSILAYCSPSNPVTTDQSNVLKSSREQMILAKSTKKLLIHGSDHFNVSPKHGIAFLQQHGILSSPLNSDELAKFLKENPRLDKRILGDYLSNRNNEEILKSYVRQFNFKSVSIDEALRVYLEAFRLPGESPLIQRIIEQFAEHWFVSNDAPFVDVDSAFTLAYAILMLNTDQHNPNSKKQNIPMSMEAFKKNLSGMNGTGDFDPELLESIFQSIKLNEIVMPSEQCGLIREHYMWRCLMRRIEDTPIQYLYAPPGSFNSDLFDLIWGPTVSALSFIFDKSLDPVVQSKVVRGFVQCAAISSKYGMSDVLDNLVISLCKFTTLLSTVETPTQVPITFGRNATGCLALRLVFTLTSNHADILRYGWYSLLDCLLQLFRANLLPDELLETEDWLISSGRVRLTTNGFVPIVDEASKKSRNQARDPGSDSWEMSVLGSLYLYLTSSSKWTGSDDTETYDDSSTTLNTAESTLPIVPTDSGKCTEEPSGQNHSDGFDKSKQFSLPNDFNAEYCMGATLHHEQLDEQRAFRLAVATVHQCTVPQLIRDSKFLVYSSLTELIKALLGIIQGSPCESSAQSQFGPFEVVDSGGGSTDQETPSLRHVHSAHGLTTADDGRTPTPPSDSPTYTESPVFINHDYSSPASVPRMLPPIKRSSTLPAPQIAHPKLCAAGGEPITEDCRIFAVELLIKVLMHNRDRVGTIWTLVQCHLTGLLCSATKPSLLLERIVVGYLRLATNLLGRFEVTSQVFACLHYVFLTRGDYLLLDGTKNSRTKSMARQVDRMKISSSASIGALTKSTVVNRIGLQIVVAITQLLHRHAADLPDPTSDWLHVFNLLEVCGAGLRSQPSFWRSRSARCASVHAMNISREHNPDYTHCESRGCTSDSESAGPSAYRLTIPDERLPASSTMPCSSFEEGHVRTGSRETTWVMVDRSQTPCNRSPATQHGSKSQTLPTREPRRFSTFHTVPDESVTNQNELPSSKLLGLNVTIGAIDCDTIKQAMDCLDFVIRDPTYITLDNLIPCVHAVRVFVEACLSSKLKAAFAGCHSPASATTSSHTHRSKQQQNRRSGFSAYYASSERHPTMSESDSESEETKLMNYMISREIILGPTTKVLASQLLELIHLLFTRATSIYTEWNSKPVYSSCVTTGTGMSPDSDEIEYLWFNCWCPLLQAAARLCCDGRREVRTEALANLQRSLLSATLQSLSGSQWEECFDKVLFPLLSGILDSIVQEKKAVASNSMEADSNQPPTDVQLQTVEFLDPRMRAIPLLTKVFLQHLRPLHESPNFLPLWTKILQYMELFIQTGHSDSLLDAVRESLKNVLLVMYTGTYDTPPILMQNAIPDSQEHVLWNLTVQHLSTFLPALLSQLFPQPLPPPCSDTNALLNDNFSDSHPNIATITDDLPPSNQMSDGSSSKGAQSSDINSIAAEPS